MRIASIVVVCGALCATPALAQNWQPKFPGIDYATYTEAGAKVHALRINLCEPGISMRATAPGEGPRTTQSFADLVGAQVAINGDWWAKDGNNPSLPQTTFPRGLAAGDGKHFPGTVDPTFYGYFAFGANRAEHTVMEHEEGAWKPWMSEVVSGQPTLVWDGATRDNPNAHCGVNRARTATGLSQDGTVMFMAVVEEVGSAGMTCNELATLMKGMGAYSALNQDGGGSSTMFIRGAGVVNKVSDGTPRTLVTHWGVHAAGQGPPRHCKTREIPTGDAAVKRHLLTLTDAAAWKFQGGDIIPTDDASLNAIPTDDTWPPGYELVQAPGDPAVYIITDGVKRHVPNPYAMNAWRFDWGGIAPIDADELAAIPTGPPMPGTPVIMKGSGPEVYIIDRPPSVDPGGDGGDGGSGGGGGDGSGMGEPGEGGGCSATGDRPSTLWFTLFGLAAMLVSVRRKRGSRDGL